MSKLTALNGTSLAAMAAFGLWAGPAFAQTATQSDEIVVTGSLIRGTPETTALPVDVISAEELIDRGSPSTLELIKSLPNSQGVLGDTNQFDSRAQGSEGSGSVNLRGLGPQRTLVLLNGRRMVINPFALAGAGAVDTNTLPLAAIGRIEVLKDGAAATYGSDAIAGVVNFITRRNFEGFEISGNYEQIDGSDGDYNLSGVYGWQGERASFLLSAGWQHRSELGVLDRDWAAQPYLSSPQGGWSAAGMPGSYIPIGATSLRGRDPGCAGIDGTFAGTTGAPPSVTPFCGWQYTQFDNITEEEDRYQLYGQFDLELTDRLNFHAEALYSRTEVPEWKTSPSYALLQGPTSVTSAVPGQYFIPGPFAGFIPGYAPLYGATGNPGLTDFVANNPAGFPGVASATGTATTIPIAAIAPGALFVAGRPFGFGGNPLYDFGPSEGVREYDAFRASAGIEGEIVEGLNVDFALTYSEEIGYRTGRDTVVNRFQRALRGLGGPDCQVELQTLDLGTGPITTAVAAPGFAAGVGPCMFFNPFASGVPGNAISGVDNPGYDPALASNENAALINWFFPEQFTRATARLFVADLVFSGETGIALGGGNVAWALGAQYRKNAFVTELSDLNNLAINPCIDSVDFGIDTCAAQTGATGFLGGAFEQDLSNSVQAYFGELNIPITDALDVQLAARYEDYGGDTGSTFDPKIALRLQVTDWLALRASAGSTFRGPSLTNITEGSVTALQEIRGTFRAIDIFGNPGLEPESANTYNAGAIIDAGGFFATVDYWRFDFENPIITDPLGAMVDTIFPSGAADRCLDPTYAALLSRFTFNASGCGLANITRVRTNVVNGTPIETDGIDVQAEYSWDMVGGTATIGGAGTYILKYEVDSAVVEGITVSQAFDGVGLLNYQTQIYSLPQLKGNAFVAWGNDTHNIRATVNYVDEYTDQRTAPFAPALSTNGTAIADGKEIDAHVSIDLNYRLNIGENTTFTAGVNNITDEDPSFARLDLNYDPFTGDPIGRTFRVGLRQRF